MLIQPLVENSIKHGISPRTSGGSIAVTVSVGERSCTIIVADDGIGVNSRNAGAGYGHASIRKRLSLQYGSNHSFIIRESNGYIVEITVPVKHTGLSGGAASTSDAVTVSGASAPESRYSSG
jgi:LytS/YehU family sensor histidine kinase